MAFTHFHFNDQTQHGRLLRRFLNGLESALDDGNDVLAVIPTMIDGNGSDAAHYAEVASRFGFPDNATAKAAWDELNSVMFKLNTDSSVDSVNAAVKQALAKFR